MEGKGSLEPGVGGDGGGQRVWGGLRGVWGHPTPPRESYVGSTERIRAAGLDSGSRSSFTGWSLAWEKTGKSGERVGKGGENGGFRHGEGSPSPLLTQQRMMSQSTAGGASVFTALRQAWDRDTRNPACSRADLGGQRGLGGPSGGLGGPSGGLGGLSGGLGLPT